MILQIQFMTPKEANDDLEKAILYMYIYKSSLKLGKSLTLMCRLNFNCNKGTISQGP